MKRERKECNWCGGSIRVIKVVSLGKELCEFCREILHSENHRNYARAYFYQKKKESGARPCDVCKGEIGAKKVLNRDLYLCAEHYKEHYQATHKPFKDLPPEQKLERTQRVLDKYIAGLREQGTDLEPRCSISGCGSDKEVISVMTGDGIVLLCGDCRAKRYSERAEWRRLNPPTKRKCRVCGERGRKIRKQNFFLCPRHYEEYYRNRLEQTKCRKCGAKGRKVVNRDFYLCPMHYDEYYREQYRRKCDCCGKPAKRKATNEDLHFCEEHFRQHSKKRKILKAGERRKQERALLPFAGPRGETFGS